MSEQICRCGQPTRDEAFVCDTCIDRLSIALGDVAWLAEELEVSVTQQQGIDYRRVGGSGGRHAPRGDVHIEGDKSSDPASSDSPALGAHMQGDPGNMSAADARSELRALLASWTLFAHETKVPNSSPTVGLPDIDLVALSRYLLWRVDGFSRLDIGPEIVDEIKGAVKRCYRVIDRPADKVYAGRCNDECPTDLYATLGKAATIKCPTCGTTWDVKERRAWLLNEAEEVLATAVEISRAVSWLGAEPLTADRVRQWAARDRLTPRGHDRKGRPMYRVGDAIDLLAQSATKKGAA